jgi:hypothetical protein
MLVLWFDSSIMEFQRRPLGRDTTCNGRGVLDTSVIAVLESCSPGHIYPTGESFTSWFQSLSLKKDIHNERVCLRPL